MQTNNKGSKKATLKYLIYTQIMQRVCFGNLKFPLKLEKIPTLTKKYFLLFFQFFQFFILEIDFFTKNNSFMKNLVK